MGAPVSASVVYLPVGTTKASTQTAMVTANSTVKALGKRKDRGLSVRTSDAPREDADGEVLLLTATVGPLSCCESADPTQPVHAPVRDLSADPCPGDLRLS